MKVSLSLVTRDFEVRVTIRKHTYIEQVHTWIAIIVKFTESSFPG